MPSTPLEDAARLVAGAKNVLILTHANPDGDGLGASIALNLALLKLGKRATIYAEGKIPDTYSFLPRLDLVTQTLPGGRDFIISVDTTQTLVEKVQFRQHEGRLDLILTPKGGSFSAEDLRTQLGEESFDLIITCDMGELRMAGKIVEDQRHLFQELPILVIDHHATNDRFGQVNLVEVTAASTTELVYRLLEVLSPQQSLLDEDIATCILNGLITDTGSFQHANTTPRSFALASTLLAAGARQQDIIRHVFKTKEFSTLKLWGLALTNLRHEPDLGLVWTYLSRADFAATATDPSQSNGLIDELLSSAPEADFVMLLREDADGVLKGSLRGVAAHIDVAMLSGLLGGGGHVKAAGFKIQGGTAADAQDIIAKFRTALQGAPQAAVASMPLERDPLVLPGIVPLG